MIDWNWSWLQSEEPADHHDRIEWRRRHIAHQNEEIIEQNKLIIDQNDRLLTALGKLTTEVRKDMTDIQAAIDADVQALGLIADELDTGFTNISAEIAVLKDQGVDTSALDAVVARTKASADQIATLETVAPAPPADGGTDGGDTGTGDGTATPTA